MTRKLSDEEIGNLLIKQLHRLPHLRVGYRVHIPGLGWLLPRPHIRREVNRVNHYLRLGKKNVKINKKFEYISLPILKKLAKFRNNYKPQKQLKMSTKLPDSKSFETDPLEGGSYPAVCYGVAIIGTVEETYQNTVKQVKKVRVFWEIPSEKFKVEFPGEEPKEYTHSISEKFTFSNSTNGNLFKMLKAWSNGQINATVIKDFDIATVVARSGAISIAQKTSSNGKTYTNFVGIAPLMKGSPIPVAEREKFVFDVEEFDGEAFSKLPKWVRIEISKSKEFIEQGYNIEDFINESANAPDNAPQDENWA